MHVQPVHKNMMNHADEDYAEAGVKASDTKAHEGKATELVKLTKMSTSAFTFYISHLHTYE